MQGWLRPNQAAEYCGISRRTLYVWFKQGLKFSKVGQCRLIKISDIDEFLERFGTTEREADQLVDEILREVAP